MNLKMRVVHLMYIWISLAQVLSSPDKTSRVNVTQCKTIPEAIRVECGFAGITPNQCRGRGCCFLTTFTSNVPWCYSVQDSTPTPRTTTQATIPEITSTATAIPIWMQKLLDAREKDETLAPKNLDSNNILTTEIDNELRCQKTARLFMRVSGSTVCNTNIEGRISCAINESLKRNIGESACQACSKKNCCYDPVTKRVNGTLVPYCFKKKENKTAWLKVVPKTNLSQTITPMKQWSGIRQEFQPGRIPVSNSVQSKRLNALVNSLTAGRFPFSTNINQNNILLPPSNLQSGINQNLQQLNWQNNGNGVFVNRPSQSTPFVTINPLIQNHPTVAAYTGASQNTLGSAANSAMASYLTNKQNPMGNILSSLQISSLPSSASNLNGGTFLTQYLLGLTPQTSTVENNLNKFSNILSNLLPSRPESTTQGNSILNELLLNKLPLSSSFSTAFNKLPTIKPTTTQTTSPLTPSRLNGIPIVFENDRREKPAKICYPSNCGHRATDGQVMQRIVGGWEAGSVKYWPWTASLRRTFRDDNRFTHICGATLISKTWIITAGHCFMAYLRKGAKTMGKAEEFVEVYSIHVGRYQRDTSEEFIQVLELDSFQAHPKYDFRSLKHDIAVAKLKTPAFYSSHVQPACIPGKTERLQPDDQVWVTGWGETYRVGNGARDKLKELRLPLISSAECRSNWPNHFHEAWICTVGAYNEDACAGDSGGPLVKQGSDGRWELVGIAIAGTRRCSTDISDIKPGIYTKVAYYRDFIDIATHGSCSQ
ncbi:uncharacterized protein LOC100181921 [Ciona intestinalis]